MTPPLAVVGIRVPVYGSRNISGAACYEHRPRGDRHRYSQAGHAGQAICVPTPDSGDPPRANASGPPDHKETSLLMAENDPMERGRAAARPSLTDPTRIAGGDC
jgi:hypothetical protein